MTHPTETATAFDAAEMTALLGVLEKSLKSFVLYLPNNPVHQQTVRGVKAAFASVWESLSSLDLLVHESGFVWDDHPIESTLPKQEGMSWILFKDGVRSVSFLPGVEESEIERFLTLIHKVKGLAADADDDLLTLLWAEDFQFIHYDNVEMGSGDVVPIEPGDPPTHPAPAAVREEVEAELQQPKGVVNIDDFDASLYFLDPHEIEYLKSEIDREYTQDLRVSVLSLLLDSFENDASADVRLEIADIIADILPYLLGSAAFDSVAFLLREVRTILAKFEDLPENVVERLRTPMAQLSQPDTLTQLFQAIEDADVGPDEGQLREMFHELGPEALEITLGWLPRLRTTQAVEVLVPAVQRLARRSPVAVGRALGSPNPEVVIGALQLVTPENTNDIIDQLIALRKHEGDDVRRALVEVLETSGTDNALQGLETFLDDPEREVRIRAVNALAAKKHRASAPKVEGIVLDKTMRRADLTEKRAFFEAYAALAGEDAIAHLAEILTAKGIRRRIDSETRACAAAALGVIGQAARPTLQLAAGDKEPVVRAAVDRALKTLEGAA